jgi:hypothetical protein
LGRRFFGLTASNKEVFLEHAFLLMYYMGFSWVECYNIPIWQRIWFIERLNKEIQKANGSRAAHDNSRDMRSLQGRHRNDPPAKLRRFT